ncbi:nuclear transport factor 2 family protein [Croceicoccus gelatinilyticus]|uniref:nuclear transport factor 2 family protein n=1 Tax=Croceicoccus gelatinilyticus TaxID=2835536 RepID=UPI001BCC12BB|nr:nuclear transport factor 2 family protein [Croceicoccus gelatinilyticus]MBS7669544.1 nuclear transport factor 2 family protein [Croceicoccus gelatinilyticus]
MANDREAALDALLDKEAIRGKLQAFSRGMDRFDREVYLSAFWDDAEVSAGPFVGSAADCWDWAMPMHREGQHLTHHALLQSNIDLDGDTAHVETYYQFVARNVDDSIVLAGGRYIDRFERRVGEFRIALRVNVIEWACMPPAIPPPFADVPDQALNGASARSSDDPSYFRPLVNRRAHRDPATN